VSVNKNFAVSHTGWSVKCKTCTLNLFIIWTIGHFWKRLVSIVALKSDRVKNCVPVFNMTTLVAIIVADCFQNPLIVRSTDRPRMFHFYAPHWWRLT